MSTTPASPVSPVIPDTHADLLDAKGFAHLTSLGPDGAPHCAPVWYGHEGEVVEVSTLRDRQKVRNVTRDPRVTLTIADPQNPYRYVELRGRVVEVRDDPDSAFVNGLTRKYMGVDEYPLAKPGDERVVLRIAVDKANAMG